MSLSSTNLYDQIMHCYCSTTKYVNQSELRYSHFPIRDCIVFIQNRIGSWVSPPSSIFLTLLLGEVGSKREGICLKKEIDFFCIGVYPVYSWTYPLIISACYCTGTCPGYPPALPSPLCLQSPRCDLAPYGIRR